MKKIYLLFILFFCVLQSCKAQRNIIIDNDASSCKNCLIKDIKKVDSIYIIDVESDSLKFKILSYSFDIKKTFKLKKVQGDYIEVGKTYNFILDEYPQNALPYFKREGIGVFFHDYFIKSDIGNVFYTTTCLQGVEIVNCDCP